MRNTFSPGMLPADEAVVSTDHFALGVRLPWYRSLPLSVVEIASLVVDGDRVPADQVRLTLNQHSYRLEELGEHTGEVWFVLDSARLDVARALDPHVDHEISVTVNLYPPYIPGLTWVSSGHLTLKAH